MLSKISSKTLFSCFTCLILVSQPSIAAENSVATDPAALQSADVTATSLVSGSNTQLQQISHYEDQIADLEFEFGPYHNSLLEPLSALAQIYIEDGDYEEAGSLLGRHLQVMRTEGGLDNPDLIPFIEAIIPNTLRLGEFSEVSDHFDHIRHLRGREDDPALVLQAMEDQANWYLARLYLDEPRLRVRNFSAARDLFRDMLDLAEDTYGEDNLAIIPWLYKEAVNQYRLLAMLNADDGLGNAAIDQILRFEGGSRTKLVRGIFYDSDQLFGPGSNVPITEGDEPVGEHYLEEGLRRVGKIRDMLEDSDDLEAQAMADIYYADFQLLLDRGSAHRNYRNARDKLLESGITIERVETFFNRPILLPVAQYFSSLEESISFQDQKLAIDVDATEPDSEASLFLGQFVAWSESLPYSQQPPLPPQVGELNVPYNSAEVSFTINRNGETSSVKVLSSEPDNSGARRDARNGVREMQFRPRMVERRSRRVRDVHMDYLYPSRNP